VFGYDANGNLTYDGASTYLYDIENRLVQASGPKSATLRYDPLNYGARITVPVHLIIVLRHRRLRLYLRKPDVAG
jgi:hypothetical protein